MSTEFKIIQFLNELEYINEKGLGGKSSGGLSSWQKYIVIGFDGKVDTIVKDDNTKFYDEDLNVIKKLNFDTMVSIIDINLKHKGNSKYAKVKYKNDIGYINITDLYKPIKRNLNKNDKNNVNSIIPGGSHSKEFTPDKLGLGGMEFNNYKTLIKHVINSINNHYKGDKFKEVRKCCIDCMSIIVNSSIGTVNEEYTKYYKIKKYNISNTDYKILSKNFGEILSAIFILKSSKKAKTIGFPNSIKQSFYDFYIIDKQSRVSYYSVKAGGGSSTGLNNLNFVLNNFKETGSFRLKYEKEIDLIIKLQNDKDNDKNTISNIYNVFTSIFKEETSFILNTLNKEVKTKINTLTQEDLSWWFSEYSSTHTSDEFVSLMQTIYKYLNLTGATKDTLTSIFNLKNIKKFKNGYLYYPMGRYIIMYLNSNKNYVETLNELLNFGTFTAQITCDILSEPAIINFNIKPFRKANFKFSYNAGAKYPDNRPLGFKVK